MPDPMANDAISEVRVFIVDKNQTFLRVTTNLLERQCGFVVLGDVCMGDEVLAQIQRRRPHVILVSLDSANEGGLRTISHLRILMPEVATIALSMLGGEACRRAALLAGADDFVSKATLTTDLVPAIRRVVCARCPRERRGPSRRAP